MSKVRVDLDLTDDDLHVYEEEARRRGVTPENLLERLINKLYQEMKQAEQEGDDIPIVPA